MLKSLFKFIEEKETITMVVSKKGKRLSLSIVSSEMEDVPPLSFSGEVDDLEVSIPQILDEVENSKSKFFSSKDEFVKAVNEAAKKKEKKEEKPVEPGKEENAETEKNKEKQPEKKSEEKPENVESKTGKKSVSLMDLKKKDEENNRESVEHQPVNDENQSGNGWDDETSDKTDDEAKPENKNENENQLSIMDDDDEW